MSPDASRPYTAADALLVCELGTRQLAASIFNCTVGSGIFALPALAVAQLGTGAPFAYLACAAVATIFAGSVMKLIPIATCLAIVWLFYETAGPHELFALALAVLVAVILYGIRRDRLRR